MPRFHPPPQTGSGPLAGVYAKLQRGVDHLKELDAKERAFLASNPYRVVEHVDSQTGWHIFTAQVTDEPPLEFGIIMGEAAYQIRSTLDHLLTAAARLRHPTAGGLNFPICLTPDAFYKRPSPKRHSLATLLRRALRPEHFTLVERAQPFKTQPSAAGATMFAFLSSFNNVDKHQVVHGGYANVRSVIVSGTKDVVIARTREVESGTELCRYLPADPKMKVHVSIHLGIGYGVLPWWWGVPGGVLGEGLDNVARLVRDFTVITPEFRTSPH